MTADSDWDRLIAEAREAAQSELPFEAFVQLGTICGAHIARYDPATVEKMLLLCQAVENELHHHATGSAPVTLAGVRDEMYAALNQVKEVLNG